MLASNLVIYKNSPSSTGFEDMKGSQRTDDVSHCEMSEKVTSQSPASNTVKAQVLKGLMGEIEDW